MKTNPTGMKCFGFFEGTEYSHWTDNLHDFESIKNTIDRSAIIGHLESLDAFVTSAKTKDVYTGEMFNMGFVDDGPYRISVDVIRYLKAGKIGVPKEYEEYLVNEIGI